MDVGAISSCHCCMVHARVHIAHSATGSARRGPGSTWWQNFEDQTGFRVSASFWPFCEVQAEWVQCRCMAMQSGAHPLRPSGSAWQVQTSQRLAQHALVANARWQRQVGQQRQGRSQQCILHELVQEWVPRLPTAKHRSQRVKRVHQAKLHQVVDSVVLPWLVKILLQRTCWRIHARHIHLCTYMP